MSRLGSLLLQWNRTGHGYYYASLIGAIIRDTPLETRVLDLMQRRRFGTMPKPVRVTVIKPKGLL